MDRREMIVALEHSLAWFASLDEAAQTAVRLDLEADGTLGRVRQWMERGKVAADPRDATISTLRAEVERLTRERDGYHGAVNALDRGTSDLHATISTLRAEVERLTKECKAQHQEALRLQDYVNASVAACGAHRRDGDPLPETIAALVRLLSGAQRDIAELCGRVDALTREMMGAIDAPLKNAQALVASVRAEALEIAATRAYELLNEKARKSGNTALHASAQAVRDSIRSLGGGKGE